ncbi:hypothetical protein AUP68_06779 [Ilyonectria robusta]
MHGFRLACPTVLGSGHATAFLMGWLRDGRREAWRHKGGDELGRYHGLNSQLAQLSANLSDTEHLLRMTSVQAEAMRGLGSWHGGL